MFGRGGCDGYQETDNCPGLLQTSCKWLYKSPLLFCNTRESQAAALTSINETGQIIYITFGINIGNY